MSHADRRPPSTAPTMKPFVTIIIVATRLRLGLYSPTSAVALGIIAPRPRPARKRIPWSCGRVAANAVSKVKAAKTRVATSSTGRRPIRSATTPEAIDPRKSPRRPAPKTVPIRALGSPHSRTSAGAT